MTHQEIADRVRQLDLDTYLAATDARVKAAEGQLAERAALRAECERLGHVFTLDRTIYGMSKARSCAACARAENTNEPTAETAEARA